MLPGSPFMALDFSLFARCSFLLGSPQSPNFLRLRSWFVPSYRGRILPAFSRLHRYSRSTWDTLGPPFSQHPSAIQKPRAASAAGISSGTGSPWSEKHSSRNPGAA